MNSNWCVLTGGPSSGKTSVIHELKKRGHKTAQEAARFHINEQLAKGRSLKNIRSDEKHFQEKVFAYKKISHSLLEPDELVFLDRGYHDTIAYLEHFKIDVPKYITRICQGVEYKKIFVLDMLSYAKDAGRIESHETAVKLHAALIDVYERSGFSVIHIPVMSIEERATLIESYATN